MLEWFQKFVDKRKSVINAEYANTKAKRLQELIARTGDWLPKLQFPETVHRRFDFLPKKYEFVCTEQNPIEVVYASAHVWVRLFYDYREAMPTLKIGLLHSETRGFDPYYLLELNDPEAAKRFRHRRAGDYDEVQRVVSELASILRQYGDKALRGDPETFEKLQMLSSVEYEEAQKTEERSLFNQLVTRVTQQGLTCPHCHQHTKDMRVMQANEQTSPHFICRLCGRSSRVSDYKV